MHLTFTSASSSKQTLKIGWQGSVENNEFKQLEKSISADWGRCDTKEACINGVFFCMLDLEIKAECKLNIGPESYHWLMVYVLKGGFVVDISTDNRPKLIPGNFYTFKCRNFSRGVQFNTSAQVMLVTLTDEFMGQLVSPQVVDAVSYYNGDIKVLAGGNFLNTRMQPILVDIMDDSKPGYIRRILIQAKILELLSMQLHQPNDDKPSDTFSNEDIKRLNEARQTVATNLQTPCSLIDLARRTGLNDYKLKKGFKALFGQTVFGYLTELRMETAYNHLQAGKTVGEVAELVGYKNAHHFTAAFKKKFSFLPSQVIRAATSKII